MTYSRLLLTTVLSAGLAGPAVAQTAGQQAGVRRSDPGSGPFHCSCGGRRHDCRGPASPVGVELLEGGELLVTAKEGAMHVIAADGTAGPRHRRRPRG